MGILQRERGSSKWNKLHIFIALLNTCLWLSLIWNDNCWSDEACSIGLLRQPFFEMLCTAFFYEDNPPLFYIIVKIIMNVFNGSSLPFIKFCMVIPMIVLNWWGVFWMINRFGKKASILFEICLIGMPSLMHYAVEIRPYSWSVLFLTMAGFALWDLLQNYNNRNWISFCFFCLCTIYTHYMLVMAIAVMWIFVGVDILLRRHNIWRSYVFASISMLVLYLPGLLAWYLRSMVIQNRTFHPYSLKDIIGILDGTFSMPLKMGWIIVVVLGGESLYVIWRIIKGSCRKEDIVCLIFNGVAEVYLLFGVILSFLYAPIFQARYFFPVVVLLYLGLVIQLSQLSLKKYVLITCILIGIGLINYGVQFKNEYKGNNAVTVTFLNNMEKKDCIYLEESLANVVAVYLPDNVRYVYKSGNSKLIEAIFPRNISIDDLKVDETYFLTLTTKDYDWIHQEIIKSDGTYRIGDYEFQIYHMEKNE